MAAQVEVSDMWGRALAQALGYKRKHLPPPIRIHRPGREEPETHRPKAKHIERDPGRIAAFFARMKG